MEQSLRTRIYGAASALLTILLIVGVIDSSETVSIILAVVESAIAVGIAVLALANLNSDTWNGLRAAVYSLALALVPLFNVFGITFDEAWLAAIAPAFALIASLLAVRNVDEVAA